MKTISRSIFFSLILAIMLFPLGLSTYSVNATTACEPESISVSNNKFIIEEFFGETSLPSWSSYGADLSNGNVVFSNHNFDKALSGNSLSYQFTNKLGMGIIRFGFKVNVNGRVRLIVEAVGEEKSKTIWNFSETGQEVIYCNFAVSEPKKVKFTLTITNLDGTLNVKEAFCNKYNACTETGASVRASTNNFGIRFNGCVDKVIFDELKNSYGESNISAGMIIVPADYLASVDFTISSLTAAGKAYLEIPVTKGWNNSDIAETNGYYGFSCAIIKLKDGNINRKYSARTYLKFVDGDKTEYVYGTFSIDNNSRSISDIANAAKNDTSRALSVEQSEIINAILLKANLQ